MSSVSKYTRQFCIVFFPILLTGSFTQAEAPNLPTLYPSSLTKDEYDVKCSWEFTKEDIYEISSFSFSMNDSIKIETGPSYVGFGHGEYGAVWAALIPKTEGDIECNQLEEPEKMRHVWIRFHPAKLQSLFPQETVVGKGDPLLYATILRIAHFKFHNSMHSGSLAYINEPAILIFDADTENATQKRFRRFFGVDRNKKQVNYARSLADAVLPESKSITKEEAEKNFDLLWETYDREYAMFVIRPEVDWNQMRETYRPQAAACQTVYQFANVCAEMLSHLRDLHIGVSMGEEGVPGFYRPRELNANPNALDTFMKDGMWLGRYVKWGKTEDDVGYISIDSWTDPLIPQQVDKALDILRDTRGLIVDVRVNGGGGEDLAMQVAGRFTKESRVYSYSQYRNGPKHTDLTEKIPRRFEPRGEWKYTQPTLILIGQKCMSSNESFIAMMEQCPQVTTMGDRTCGSSGNPKMIELSIGVNVRMPKWIDLLMDEKPLDERGIQPDIFFEAKPDSFTENRDELLSTAIERLKNEPLPPWVQVNPSVQMLTPFYGTKNVKPETELCVQFDRPMNPQAVHLVWKEGGYLEHGEVRYERDANLFLIPVILKPGIRHHIIINPAGNDPPTGFQSSKGIKAEEAQWIFETKPIEPSPEQTDQKPWRQSLILPN